MPGEPNPIDVMKIAFAALHFAVNEAINSDSLPAISFEMAEKFVKEAEIRYPLIFAALKEP